MIERIEGTLNTHTNWMQKNNRKYTPNMKTWKLVTFEKKISANSD